MPKHAVVCPWTDQHTTGGGPSDTSTVLFEPDQDHPAWGFRCLHAHCTGRTMADALMKLGVTDANAFLTPKGRVGNETQFSPKPLSAFLAERPEPISWVLQSYIPEGALVLLASYPKVGKTTWIYALIIAVARGQTFMGFGTRRGPVLLLAVEERRQDVQIRFFRFAATHDDGIYVHAAPLNHDSEFFAQIAAFILEHQIQLVVLDTLGSFWQIPDENDNAQVERHIRPWRDLARTTNCAVVLIHHQRKIKGEGGREIRGGSALLGGVDQALLLDHRQGGSPSQRVLSTVGRYDASPKGLVLELVGNDYVSRGTVEETDSEAMIGKITSVLSDAWQTISTIVETTGLPDGQVRRTLETLAGRDQAERAGAGRKGDPYTYRRQSNAFPPQDHPRGKKSKPEPGN
jgi:hypothetical protein